MMAAMIHRPRLVATACLTLALLAATAASCGDDDAPPPVDGGQGGTGGMEPEGCTECTAAEPICVDDDHCASDCPTGRSACHTAEDADAPAVCCESGEQCCAAALHGYPTDRCNPSNSPCPVLCPDGTTVCTDGQFCLLDAFADTYSCANECNSFRSCGTLCCPLGSQCVAGACELPDLTINAERVGESAILRIRDFEANSCEMQEGCIMADGERTLLRFDLETPNIGEGNLHLGDPTLQTDLFTFSPCHAHYHFDTYASYRLLDASMNVVATGHKQAFCLLDFNRVSDLAPEGAIYDCSFQGIQAGWSDVYSRSLDCQWVDVTGLPAGDYMLEVELNYDHLLGESNYDNNLAQVPVTVPENSCTLGCKDIDTACCGDDTCGTGDDGSCDCGGVALSEAADCASCFYCAVDSSCPGGCTPLAGNACCAAGDPCGAANDGICDCEGTESWDDADCSSCASTDPECQPVDSCPSGCPDNAGDPCCSPTDDCGYSGDGYCDCGGMYDWDFSDCFNCSCN
jgi:hypothetical protein